MPRQNSHKHHDESHYRRQEYPATELAEALGLPAADRFGYDYSLTLALKERLADICIRCAIRFGIPDQNRKHLGDAIGLPDEPILRYPHHESNIDPRWEKLANASLSLPRRLPTRQPTSSERPGTERYQRRPSLSS